MSWPRAPLHRAESTKTAKAIFISAEYQTGNFSQYGTTSDPKLGSSALELGLIGNEKSFCDWPMEVSEDLSFVVLQSNSPIADKWHYLMGSLGAVEDFLLRVYMFLLSADKAVGYKYILTLLFIIINGWATFPARLEIVNWCLIWRTVRHRSSSTPPTGPE